MSSRSSVSSATLPFMADETQTQRTSNGNPDPNSSIGHKSKLSFKAFKIVAVLLLLVFPLLQNFRALLFLHNHHRLQNDDRKEELMDLPVQQSTSIDAVDICDKGYLEMNPDVAIAVKKGKLQSGFQHWNEQGKREGRKPHCKEWLKSSEPSTFDGHSSRRRGRGRGRNKRTSTVSLNRKQDTVTPISSTAFIMRALSDTATSKTQVGAVKANKAANAVIHIGPHKTGTTAIQHYSKVLYPELVLDKYEMPWKHLKQNVKPWENQVEFATCFTPELEDERSKYPCRQDLLEAGLNIARQSNHSLLVSAETFAGTKAIGVAELKSYLDQAWSNVTIVATYRRYYEWIVSFHHEVKRIKQSIAGATLWQAIQKNETERIYPGIQDTLSKHRGELEHNNPTAVIERYKQVFSNVVVMNYHDKSKDLIERFYCDAIPNAPNACKKAIEMTKTKGEAKINQSYSAVYEELTYAAHRSGMINVHSQKYCEAVTTAIKAHQEKTLKLSSDDFPHACPSSKVLGEIWDITLRSEKDFNKHVNEGEGSILSTSLKDDFDAYTRTNLCHVDVHAILQSQVWRDFFLPRSKVMKPLFLFIIAQLMRIFLWRRISSRRMLQL